MTLDEVIAANVRRRREELNLSVADLAGRLDVGKHLVYDLERPRAGQQQREFAWSELVELCRALETNLFDLVLPPEDVKVEFYNFDTSGDVDLSAAAQRAGAGELAEILDRPDRAILGWLLFGVDGRDLDPEMFRSFVEKANRERRQVLDAVTPEMWRKIRENL